MQGLSDNAIKTQYAENKYRYNDGNELQNKEFSDGTGLEMYDANFRNYDPQLGRFWQIDPLGELNEGWSPYSFANDNPILLNDPTGLTISDSSHPQKLEEVIVTAALPNKTDHTPDVAAAAGPAPSSAEAPIKTSGSSLSENTKVEDRGDHNTITDIAYEINKFNPLANLWNGVETYFTHHDSYGVKQSTTTATFQILSVIPLGRVASAGTNIALITLNLIGKPRLVADVLNLAERILGPGYTEIAPGVFRSADGLKQFRRTASDLQGIKFGGVPHIHIEVFAQGNLNTPIANYHIPLIDP